MGVDAGYGAKLGGGSGSGFTFPDSATFPFADTTARDVWAAANLGDLIQNSTVVEVTDTPDNTWYMWTGETAPASHDNSLWRDIGFVVRGSTGAAGSNGVDGTNGTDGADGAAGAAGVVQAVVAGTNVTVDSSDPANPIVASTGGGGGGQVNTVVAGDNVSVDATDPVNPAVSATDQKVSVSANDTTPGNLEAKIVAGTNVTVETLNEGADEQFRINAAGGGGGGSGPIVVEPIAGNYYRSNNQVLSSENVTVTLSGDTLYIIPFIVFPGVYDQLGFHLISLSGATKARLALYDMGSDGIPVTLLAETPDIPLAGTFQSYFGAIAATLEWKEYGLGLLFDGGAEINSGGIATSGTGWFGMNMSFTSRDFALSSQSVSTGWLAMPDPATDTILYGTPNSDQRPIIVARAGTQT